MNDDPKRQAERDHLKRQLYFAREEFRRQEQLANRAEEEVYRLQDLLTELGVNVDAEEEEG